MIQCHKAHKHGNSTPQSTLLSFTTRESTRDDVDTTRESTSDDVDMDDAYKESTPRGIICAELATPIMMVEALSQIMCFIN